MDGFLGLWLFVGGIIVLIGVFMFFMFMGFAVWGPTYDRKYSRKQATYALYAAAAGVLLPIVLPALVGYLLYKYVEMGSDNV